MVFLDRLARSACLLEERCASSNAVLYAKSLSWLWLRHWDGLDRPACRWSQPGQQL
jgi:hypothetical protein